jgi:hypothetical protein
MNKIFNNGQLDHKQTIELLREKLTSKVPFINVNKAALGDDMIMILISFEPKENWSYGYVENSNYIRLHIEDNGVIEQFVCSLYQKDKGCSYENRLNIKFRKCTVQSLDKAIEKLCVYIDKVNEHYK